MLEPNNIKEALKLLKEHNKEAKLLAGGTDLFIDIKNSTINPEYLISLSKIESLRTIKKTKEGLFVGSMTNANEIADNNLIQTWLPALSDAALSMASYQIRNLATIGGNICSAVPSADLPPPLIVGSAKICLSGLKSERSILLSEFFLGPRKTEINEDEIVTGFLIPVQPPNTGVSYKKFKLREANSLPTAAVAARITLKKGVIHDACLALGAVAPVPMVASDAMKILIGQKPSKDLFAACADKTFNECKPISDVRCCADYRRELIKTLTKRALEESLVRAGGV
jgi:carbon-monoxide dehydrogenase medium subunit